MDLQEFIPGLRSETWGTRDARLEWGTLATEMDLQEFIPGLRSETGGTRLSRVDRR